MYNKWSPKDGGLWIDLHCRPVILVLKRYSAGDYHFLAINLVCTNFYDRRWLYRPIKSVQLVKDCHEKLPPGESDVEKKVFASPAPGVPGVASIVSGVTLWKK